MASYSQVLLHVDGELQGLNFGAKNHASSVLMEFGLHFLTEAKTLAPRHFVKATRAMIKTLRAALAAAIQNYAEIAFSTVNSDASQENKEAAFEAVFNLRGLIHFYIRGLEGVDTDQGEELGESYANFLRENEQIIYRRALLYCGFDV